jgi:hypothetical protein
MNRVYTSEEEVVETAKKNNTTIFKYYVNHNGTFDIGICSVIDSFIYMTMLDSHINTLHINGEISCVDDLYIVTKGSIEYER